MEANIEQTATTSDNLELSACEGFVNHADLQKFSSGFEKWYNSSLSLMKTNIDLADELDVQRTANKNLNDKLTSLSTENQRIQDALNNLYCKMHIYCDSEKEVEDLRDQIETVNKNYLQIQEQMKRLEESHVQKEEMLRQDVNIQKELLQKEFCEKMEEKTAYYEEIIQKKNQELKELDALLKKQDIDHKAEMTSQSMEWEEKLSKLKQKLEQKQTKMSSSNNQEIFRMKFLNLKQEYDVEMKKLQQVIQTLEERLRSRSTENTAVLSGRPSLKKRKLWRHR